MSSRTKTKPCKQQNQFHQFFAEINNRFWLPHSHFPVVKKTAHSKGIDKQMPLEHKYLLALCRNLAKHKVEGRFYERSTLGVEA